MKGKNHLTCGVIAGAGCAAISMYFNDINISQAITLAACTSVASLLPDIDMPNSMLGKIIKPISKLIYKLFGHRTLTHSFLWAVLFYCLFIANMNNNYHFVFLGLFMGFMSHIISDTFTRGGVAWLWPFDRKRFRITSVNSGEKDILFIILTDIILIGSYFLVLRSGILYEKLYVFI